MKHSVAFKAGIIIITVLVYFAAGKLGLSLASVHQSATAVWAPTGIALAALLLFGYELWPAIFAAAFLVNFSTTDDFWSSIFIGVGNTLEGVVGAWLINQYASGVATFNRFQNIIKFILFGGILSPLIASSIGVGSLILFNLAITSQAGSIWITWWLGDATGALVVAPVLILWFSRIYNKPKISVNRVAEWTFFLMSLLLVNGVIFWNFIPILTHRPTGFLLIPLLVWSALRFSRKETSVAMLITASIAIWGTIHGFGPFANETISSNESLLLLQAFIAVITLTGLILAEIVTENKQNAAELARAYDHALEGWSRALDLRDQEIEGHSIRVADLSVQLAAKLGLTESDQVNIRRGALLHDIGKMVIPDTILFKSGPLTDEEWAIMRQHPVFGANLLSDMSFFDKAREILYCHHEKWDGSGYPKGLKETDIPLLARIFTIVDVWDALRSKRPYRHPLTDREIFDHLVSLRGRHFDPEIVDAFVKLMKVQA